MAHDLLSKPMLDYCSTEPWEQITMKFESIMIIFIEENEFENVLCNISAIS